MMPIPPWPRALVTFLDIRTHELIWRMHDSLSRDSASQPRIMKYEA